MDHVLEMRTLLSTVLLNCCFYVTPIKDYSFVSVVHNNFLVSSISPTALATHMTTQVTAQTTQISGDVDSNSTYILIKDH